MSHGHSHNCADEHAGHDHGDDGHAHNDELTPAIQSSLYNRIDIDKIITLNEAVQGSGKDIIKKTWEERLDESRVLKSDADEQLLMVIPFTGHVKLHSIILRTSASPSAPKTLKVYINRDDLDFSTASDLQPTQTLELPLTSEVVEVPVKRALFNNTRSLTLFFEDNYGDGEEDTTIIYYMGFKGDWMKLTEAPVIALYEAAPNPADHKNMMPGTKYGSMGVGPHGGRGY